MNKPNTFIGIDVSKKTFDAALLCSAAPQKIQHRAFAQSAEGYRDFVVWFSGFARLSEVLVCMEHTGLYCTSLVGFLVKEGLGLWVEMPLRIKRSMGLQRGGDDKLAAIAIAQYAYRFSDQCRLWQPADAVVEQLRHLIALRERLVQSLTKLTVPLEELRQCGAEQESKALEKLQASVLRSLERSIAKTEAAIGALLSSNEEVKTVIERVTSIKGIGRQTAINLYVYTRGFTGFKTAKQLACYCGVVPFAKSSGTSVRYKPSLSPFANRKLKKLLHLCAMCALRFNEDLRRYYNRKVAEGKNKMSVVNAIRNKLLQRIFAVVRDGRMYVENQAELCV